MQHKKLASSAWLLSLVLIFFLYPKMQNPATLQQTLAMLGAWGIILDLVIVSLLMLFPIIPFVLIAGINTVLFGSIGGFFLSLLGSVLGSSLGFALARNLGQGWAAPKLRALGKTSDLIREQGFWLVLMARLVPVLPSAAVNYASGVSPMTFSSFIAATIIGKTSMIIWESWVGHDFWLIKHYPERFVFALLSGLVLFLITGFVWYRLTSDKSVIPFLRKKE